MKTTKFAKIIALVLTLALLVGSVMTLSVSAETATDSTGKILAQSVIYGEKTYIMFAVQAENASDVTVTYTWEGDETVYTASVYDGAEYEGAVIFVTDGVALYELGKKVTASVSVDGQVVDTKVYSVADFLYRQLYNKADSLTPDQKAFYESLLVCGANAQKYIAKETENLVTDLTYVYTDNAEVTVNGGKYALVNSGATVELAYTGKLPVFGWTLGENYVETKANPYTATVSGDKVKVDVDAVNYDPSYMTQKDATSYYISDFNNASVIKGVDESNCTNPWFNAYCSDNGTATQGTYTTGHGTFTGLHYVQNTSGYSGFNYVLPSAFVLSNAEKIVVRVAYSGWSANNACFFVAFRSGNEITNAINYANLYVTNAATTDGVTPSALGGNTVSINFMTCFVEIDVAALVAATGFTSIDTIYFGQNSTGMNFTIDEVYYTVPHEHEFVEGKCVCGEEDPNYVPPMPAYDPSYMTQKGEGTYYISDFNNASVMEGVTEEVWNNPWLNSTGTLPEYGTVTQGAYTTGHGAFTGLHYTQEASGYTGFSYKLPAAFDLSQADKIVVRIAYNGWNSHYANCYILVKSGDKVSKVLPYSKMYSTNNATIGTTAANTIGDTINVNFMTCFVEIDVAALVEASGFTSIDAIYFGQNNTSMNFTVDEIYYTAK